MSIHEVSQFFREIIKKNKEWTCGRDSSPQKSEINSDSREEAGLRGSGIAGLQRLRAKPKACFGIGNGSDPNLLGGASMKANQHRMPLRATSLPGQGSQVAVYI